MGILKILFCDNNNIKRLYLLINMECGIEIPQAKILTIKQQNSRLMRTYEGTSSNIRNNDDDRNAPKATNQRATYSDT